MFYTGSYSTTLVRLQKVTSLAAENGGVPVVGLVGDLFVRIPGLKEVSVQIKMMILFNNFVLLCVADSKKLSIKFFYEVLLSLSPILEVEDDIAILLTLLTSELLLEHLALLTIRVVQRLDHSKIMRLIEGLSDRSDHNVVRLKEASVFYEYHVKAPLKFFAVGESG